MILLRRRLMMNKSRNVEPVLPDQYQRCDWVGVENNANKQTYIYISDLSLTKANLADYVFRFTMSDITDGYSPAMVAVGIVCGASSAAGCYFASRHNLLGMGYDSIGQYPSTPKRDYEMRWTASGGTVYSGDDEIATRNFTNSSGAQRFRIGCTADNNYPKSFYCYRAKIFYQNTLITDCIPAYRKSDGAIGFYDVIGNVFRYSTGNSAFTAKGADVS